MTRKSERHNFIKKWYRLSAYLENEMTVERAGATAFLQSFIMLVVIVLVVLILLIARCEIS